MVFFQTKVTNIITIYYISLQKIFLPRLENLRLLYIDLISIFLHVDKH